MSKHNMKKVTLVYKANIIKVTDELFIEVATLVDEESRIVGKYSANYCL
jgi:isocitrate/isopropylmalate dehydrogenase